jgi:hypothetical protein
MVSGIGQEKREALVRWMQRVEWVWASPVRAAPAGKKFVGKNGLPRLDSYADGDGVDFWEKFPVNVRRTRDPIINPVKVRALARQ